MKLAFAFSLALAAATHAQAPLAPTPTRAQLFRALVSAGTLNPDRRLVHLSHVCNLKVDGRFLPVVDIQERIKGASSPRGLNRLVVLNPQLKPVHDTEYGQARPLFCDANTLYLWDEVEVNDRTARGNVLTFSDGGRAVKASTIEANDLPAPPTRERRSIQ